MALGIKNLVGKIPLTQYRAGDVFITNDPWALAGHLNDICVFSPIFYKGNLVAFTACVFHHSDIGGRVSSDNLSPGGMVRLVDISLPPTRPEYFAPEIRYSTTPNLKCRM